MWIKRLKLQNVRAFRDLSLPPDSKATLPQHVVIIGGNSTCKTTLLRAIVLGFATSTRPALLAKLPGSMIGRASDSARIVTNVQSQHDYIDSNTEIVRSGGRDKIDLVSREFAGKSDPFRKSVLCAYGSNRGVVAPYRDIGPIEHVQTLFDRGAPLQVPELVLRRLRDLSKSAFNVVVKRLLEVMGLSSEHKLELTKEGIEVHGPLIGDSIPLDALADGFRGTLCLVCDMVGAAMLADALNVQTGDIRGVALIDELEQHLHPSAQMNLLRNLGRAFPSLQVIATTHSPIIALTAPPDGLFALRRTSPNTVDVLPHVAGLTHYAAQDVLEDENLFGVDAERPELEADRLRYQKLVSIPEGKLSPKQKRELTEIGVRLQGSGARNANEGTLAKSIRELRKQLDL